MKTLVLILLLLIGAFASAQTNLLTFTNNSGVIYSNARVVKVETDGVLLGYTNWQYTRVKFTNMPTPLQKWFGYDPEQIRKANENRQAKEIAEAKAAQVDSIQEYKDNFFMYKFDESDFPKTDAARQACKEIVAELNGISKALEIGVSYNKFADLLTDKALAVEKIKDLRGEGIPREFSRHADACVDAFKESKQRWNQKIQDEHPEIKILDELFMREYWARADLRLICCSGIAESNTNAITLVIDKMAEMIKSQQDAVKDGILDAKGSFDPHISGLTVEQIAARLKAALSATNAPATN